MTYRAETCSCCGAVVFPDLHERWPIYCCNCRAQYVRGVMLRRQSRSAGRPVSLPVSSRTQSAASEQVADSFSEDEAA